MVIRDNNGELIGAVSVTGHTQERDEELAAHGIRAMDRDCPDLGSKVRLELKQDTRPQARARQKEHRAN